MVNCELNEVNSMRTCFVASALGLLAVAWASSSVRAQAPAPARPATTQAARPSSAAVDLSGDWEPDRRRGGFGQSFSLSDQGGRNRGKEDDIPYQPWAREKTLSEKPSTGPQPYFGETTDPQVLYCEPPGVPHIYLWPIKTKFIQTPQAVYILYELGPFYRVVWLNSKHPDDPDPQWWGHSVGHYEDGNTLVIDTVGFTDKTWLDQMGHPNTEQLHLIERYKRVDATTLELDITIDDPGAYTKPWMAHRNFTTSKTGFLRFQQICSTRENRRFEENLAKPAM